MKCLETICCQASEDFVGAWFSNRIMRPDTYQLNYRAAQCQKIKLLEWRSGSPDMIPMQNLSGILVHKIYVEWIFCLGF